MPKLRLLLNLVKSSGGILTLEELARRLEISPALARGMVEFWVQRGELGAAYGEIVHCKAVCAGCSVTACPLARAAPQAEGAPCA